MYKGQKVQLISDPGREATILDITPCEDDAKRIEDAKEQGRGWTILMHVPIAIMVKLHHTGECWVVDENGRVRCACKCADEGHGKGVLVMAAATVRPGDGNYSNAFGACVGWHWAHGRLGKAAQAGTHAHTHARRPTRGHGHTHPRAHGHSPKHMARCRWTGARTDEESDHRDQLSRVPGMRLCPRVWGCRGNGGTRSQDSYWWIWHIQMGQAE